MKKGMPAFLAMMLLCSSANLCLSACTASPADTDDESSAAAEIVETTEAPRGMQEGERVMNQMLETVKGFFREVSLDNVEVETEVYSDYRYCGFRIDPTEDAKLENAVKFKNKSVALYATLNKLKDESGFIPTGLPEEGADMLPDYRLTDGDGKLVHVMTMDRYADYKEYDDYEDYMDAEDEDLPILSVYLNSEDGYFDAEYCGLPLNADIETVINRFGERTASVHAAYDYETDACHIYVEFQEDTTESLGYPITASFGYEYDAKANRFRSVSFGVSDSCIEDFDGVN